MKQNKNSKTKNQNGEQLRKTLKIGFWSIPPPTPHPILTPVTTEDLRMQCWNCLLWMCWGHVVLGSSDRSLMGKAEPRERVITRLPPLLWLSLVPLWAPLSELSLVSPVTIWIPLLWKHTALGNYLIYLGLFGLTRSEYVIRWLFPSAGWVWTCYS